MHSTIQSAFTPNHRLLALSWLLALPIWCLSPQLRAAAESPFALYVTTNTKTFAESEAVEQTSVLVEHCAVLKCTALTPGKTYRSVWSLKDAEGQEILTQPELKFTATRAHEPVVMLYVPPDRIPKAGKWTWKVTVDGQGTFSKQIAARPPTGDEAAKLATFEQVRENVLHAFALSWRLYNGSLFTLVGAGSPEEKLIQVAGARIVFNSPGHVTPADELNGIKYRGTAAFSFRVWREFSSAEGWTEWEDVSRRSNDLSEFVGSRIANVPRSFAINCNVGFVAYIKGGKTRDAGNDHCWVKTDDGAEFYDRRRTKSGTGLVQCPTKAFVVKALNEGDSLFKRERAAVQNLRSQPENTVEDIKETKDAIRATLGPLQSILLWNNVPTPSSDR